MNIDDGVWPVMITPFTEDNHIDYDSVLQIIDWYDRMGVAGIFAVCQSSEMFQLTLRERLALMQFVVDHTPGHMGVIASGHVAEVLQDQIDEAKAAIDTGIQAYVFVSNRFAGEDESEEKAKRRIELLIRSVDAESFGIYECPYPYKRLLSPGLLKWCAETGKFSFLKDTCCNLDQLRAKCDAAAGTELKIFNANAATLLESLKLGCAGYSGVMANFHPDLYVWLCGNYQKEPQKASVVQDALGSASIIEYQAYPVNAKYHMWLEGIDMSVSSRVMSEETLTQSKRMEVEQLRRSMEKVKEYVNQPNGIMPEGITI